MEKKIDDKHYKGHIPFWECGHYFKHPLKRPEKYCVIFNTWKDTPESFSCTEFNTLEDALDEAKELNKMYSNTPKPIKLYNEKGKYREGEGWRSEKYDWLSCLLLLL